MTVSPEPLRSVVIGAGRMGTRHGRIMADSDDYDLVAVCDQKEEMLLKAAGEFPGVRTYADAAEMLDAQEPDVVTVATAGGSHARLTLLAAEVNPRGICSEKPMATCLEEGRAMVAACRERGISLIVNHQRRMGVPLLAMRRLIDEGAIGEVYLIRGSCPGDVLGDGTHLINSIRWFAGDAEVKWAFGQIYRDKPDPAEPQSVTTRLSGGYRYGYPVEGGAVGVFEFSSGVRAEIYVGGLRLPGRSYQDYEVFGTEGRLWRQGDMADPPVLILDEQGGGWRPAPLFAAAGPVQPHDAGPMAESYDVFARTIREGAPHPLAGESVLKGLEVAMAVYESARTHRRIEFPLQQGRFPLQLMIESGQV
jgi:predicted dehydrogenase